MEILWWVIIILIASAITALTVFCDNFLMDTVFKKRSPLSPKIIYAIIHIILVVILLLFFDIQPLSPINVWMIIVSGVAYSLALIPYYKALSKEDSVAVEIFSQMEPAVCLVFGWIFLKDVLTPVQCFAFLLILASSIIVVASKNKRKQKSSIKASFWALLAAAIWAGADLSVSAIEVEPDYVTLLFYTLVGRALVDAAIFIFMKDVRTGCFRALKKSGIKNWWVVFLDYFLEIGSDLLYRVGLLTAPVALASVIGASSEIVFTFIFGVILTIFIPKFGREDLSKKTIIANLIALIVLVIGVVLIS